MRVGINIHRSVMDPSSLLNRAAVQEQRNQADRTNASKNKMHRPFN